MCGRPRFCYLTLRSHLWLATVQEVLQADWQEAWHSPQPPLTALSLRLGVLMVLMYFTIFTSVVTR